MNDVKHILQRQAAWQKGRAAFPWPDKIRMAGEMREAMRQLRTSRNKTPRSDNDKPAEPQENAAD